jgi:hypothetical protein
MPTDDRVGVHDEQGGAPLSPDVGQQQPKQPIAGTEWGTLHRALEQCQLLTQRQILERDCSVSPTAQRERSKRDDERSQHGPSCPAIDRRINRVRQTSFWRRTDIEVHGDWYSTSQWIHDPVSCT